MTDAQLLEELARLGVDEASHRVVLLLPLVQVAWADGRVQPRELELILEIARARGAASGKAGQVLEGWLRERPDDETIQRGRAVLVALALRHRGTALPEDSLAQVVEMCSAVARAAGGLFDVLFTVVPSEREAIAEISSALRLEADTLREALPSPDGGRFEDLQEQTP